MRFCPRCRVALKTSEPVCPRDGNHGVEINIEAVPDELLERYEIVEPFAHGDGGSLYLADEKQTARRGILKILGTTLSQRPSDKQRLRRDLVRQAMIVHPLLTLPLVTGEAADSLWLFRPWIEGISLDVKLARTGPLPPAEVIGITALLAEALEGLHQAGLIHRDVKPGHVLLLPQPSGVNKVTLIDAGIAAPIAEETEPFGVSLSVIGSPRTISPEQASGKLVSFRSDLYSLGCVMYEMLTGKPLFSANTNKELLLAHQQEPPPKPPTDIHPSIAALLTSLLEKEPRKRPFSAQQVRRALEPFVADAARGEKEITRTFDTSDEGGSLPTDLDMARASKGPSQLVTATGTLRPIVLDRTGELEMPPLASQRPSEPPKKSLPPPAPVPSTRPPAQLGRQITEELSGLVELNDPANSVSSMPAPRSVPPAFRPPKLLSRLAWVVQRDRKSAKRLIVVAGVSVALLLITFAWRSSQQGDAKTSQVASKISTAPKSAKDVEKAVPPEQPAAPLPAAKPVAEAAPASPPPSEQAADTAQNAEDDTDVPSERSASERVAKGKHRKEDKRKSVVNTESSKSFEKVRDEARALYSAKEYSKAAQAYSRAAALKPNNAGMYGGLGAARLGGGDVKGAIAAYQKAIRISPKSAGFHLALGRAYETAGKNVLAAKEYKKAVSLDPKNQSAKQALESLR